MIFSYKKEVDSLRSKFDASLTIETINSLDAQVRDRDS